MAKIRKPSRHTFRFRIETKGEKDKEIRHKAKVIRAKKGVKITLTAEDVERSLRLNGVGNCQTCAMAVATKRQADELPHSFAGMLDWTYTKAHIVSKLNRATGLPAECYAYQHSDDVARLFDTKAGQKKLLAKLREDGPMTIALKPIKYREREEGRPKGRNDGSRSSRPTIMSLKGAHRRFAVAQLGGFVG